jgi:hypothetical protein
MSDVMVRKVVKPVNEVEARRVTAGVDADLIDKEYLSPEEADAMSLALRRYLLGDVEGARKELEQAFDGAADQILAEFGKLDEAA